MAASTEVYQGRAYINFHGGLKHYYTVRVPGVIERLYQPGVTTILGIKDKSGALVPWAVKQCAEYAKQYLATAPDTLTKKQVQNIIADMGEHWRDAKQEAADIGSVAHRFLYAELMYRGGLGEKPIFPIQANAVLAPDLREDMIELANNSISAGLQFFDEHHIKPIIMERPLWSPSLAIIGTGDMIAEIDGELSVLDYKSGKYLYPEVFLQTAAYQFCYTEEFPRQVITARWAVNIRKTGELDSQRRGIEHYSEDLDAFLGLYQGFKWERCWGYRKSSPIEVLGNLDLLVPRPADA